MGGTPEFGGWWFAPRVCAGGRECYAAEEKGADVHSINPSISLRSRHRTRNLAARTAPALRPNSLAHLDGRPALDDALPARLPGARGELGLHDDEQPAGEVAPVVRLPERLVVGVGQLVEALDGGRRRGPATDLAPAVEGHGPQPGAEPLVLVVGELRQFADQQGEDVLNQVGRVRLLQPGAARRAEQQRRVQMHEARPRLPPRQDRGGARAG